MPRLLIQSVAAPNPMASVIGGVPASNLAGTGAGVNPSRRTSAIMLPPPRNGGVASSSSARPHRAPRSQGSDLQARALAVTNDTVYVGGGFGGTGMTVRNNILALRASDGALLAWDPNADYTVSALALSDDGAAVFAGGSFQNVGGQPAYGLAKIDAATGALLPWQATVEVRNAGVDAGVTSLRVADGNVYGTTYHFGAGGNLEGPFSVSASTGALNWAADCHGDTYSSAESNGVVYVVGHSHYCGNVGGGLPQPSGWTYQRAIAFTKDAARDEPARALRLPEGLVRQAEPGDRPLDAARHAGHVHRSEPGRLERRRLRRLRRARR